MLLWAASWSERSKGPSFGQGTARTQQHLEVPIPTRHRYLSKPGLQFQPVKSNSIRLGKSACARPEVAEYSDDRAAIDGRAEVSFQARIFHEDRDRTARIRPVDGPSPRGRNQTELKRADLTGKDMDVIVTVIEVPPGKSLARHIHPGEEVVVYVLEGATIELPDDKQMQFPTGAAVINARDVPHAGIKIVGDKTLKNAQRAHCRQGKAND